MKKIYSPLLVLGLLIFTLTFFFVKYSITNTYEENLEESMLLYTDWLVKNQTKQGDFNYELDVSTGRVIEGYNIVRQAGGLYSLCQVYQYEGGSKYEDSIEKGIDFFHGLYEDVENDVPTIAINHEGVKKSNSVALYLLALVEYMEGSDQAKEEYMQEAKSLANYLLFTQTDEGSFIYLLDTGRESDYNNGESFYALIRIYRLSNDERYLIGAQKAAEYIIDRYSNEDFNYSIYAWAMEGFAYLYQIDNSKEYWDFMKMYTQEYFRISGIPVSIYLDTSTGYPPKANLGVYLEGLAHVAWIAKERDYDFYIEIKEFMSESLKYLMSLQIDGPKSDRKTEFDLISGGICYDYECDTQRIDLTHHNLSAIYLYLKYVD